jgi:hypothetical protein
MANAVPEMSGQGHAENHLLIRGDSHSSTRPVKPGTNSQQILPRARSFVFKYLSLAIRQSRHMVD